MMQKIIVASFFLIAATGAMAQTKKPAAPVKKPAPSATSASTSLKTFADSASYALGLNIAQSLKRDLGNLKPSILLEAMKGVFNNQPARFDEDVVKNILMELSNKEQAKQSQAVVDEGRAFLAKNKTNPKIKTTASGLQYEVLKEGAGTKPTANDTVVVNYRGSLIDSTEFDNSYDRGEPLSIHLGSVIKGWTEGVQLMSPGAKYKFYIPQELGYGLRNAGQIPAGSALIFEIELLEVRRSR